MAVFLPFEFAPSDRVSHLPRTAVAGQRDQQIIACEALTYSFLELVSAVSEVLVAAGIVDPDEAFLFEFVIGDIRF